MRRSREINLTLLAALAFTMTACRDENRDCVDPHNRKLPDSVCEDNAQSPYGAHYVYGGSSGGHVGDTVVGGGVSRGGFGGTGGFGGHAGGE